LSYSLFSVLEIQTSRAVLYMMIAFAVIPTVAFKWVYQTWTILCYFWVIN